MTRVESETTGPQGRGDDLSDGPLQGLRAVEFGQLLAGPVRRHAARRLRRRRDQGRGAAERRRDARLGPPAPQRPLAVVVDPRAQQALGHAQPARAEEGQRIAHAARATTPTSCSRTSGPARWRSGASAPRTSTRRNPRADLRARHRLRPDRPLPRPPGLRLRRRGDLAACATSTATPDQAPPRTGISLGDTLAAQSAFQGILLALYARDARGADGQVVDASIVDACFAMTRVDASLEYEKTGVVREPTGPAAAAHRAVERLPVQGRQAGS